MPIVAVLGATGTQGGSVSQALLESSKWQVRCISRNPSSEAAKKLAAKGVQVVHADPDDETSLVKAFEGATVIFCVSNFGELAVVEPSLQAAADHERDQLIKAAKAAAPSIEKHAWLLSSKETALLPVAGDSRINTGVVVRAVLEQPEKTHGKFIPIITEYVPISRALEAWEKTTSRSAIYGEVSDESFAKTFGAFGTEMADQLRFSEEFPDWGKLFQSGLSR
ncbi:uncharacterized protein BKA55DRAFT_744709 [Fusarium redolens]|uniref:NmrA-like domain-containing protein n=1 Tax=Fusarium redolens TaxID=48865 RepID=A0A9P9JPS1_FUSRE|nr:uncharacterized protein BKA55DRAFT_744709 [Fusarium redolens]KAH7205147.1 hypothetical protein BKA55DRAFT_744709 [Fusarium redolens]